jgi:glycosyltransferase involved in cell wall biosynthesis
MFDVSIIISTFNRLWCLPRAIESCRGAQCATEIVVVDDGSTDGTWEWMSRHSGIVALWQPHQGQTWAINKGFNTAKGRYIRFLDSDDYLAPGIIDRQFEAAERSDADVVCSRVDIYSQNNGTIRENPELSVWDDFMGIQLGEAYGSHFLGMMFRRELVEQVPRRPDFANREDRMFLLELALLKPRVICVSGCAGYWVQHNSQMQANYLGMKAAATNWQHLEIYRRILRELERRGELTQRRKKAACKVLWPLAHWIAYSHPDDACEVAEWVFKLDPEFHVPEPGALGMLYRHLGFRATEMLLRFRRIVRGAFIRKPRSQKLELI